MDNKAIYLDIDYLIFFTQPLTDIVPQKISLHLEKSGLTHYPEANTRVNIWRDRCDRQSCKFLACIEKNSENSANNLVYRNPTEAWTMVLTPLFKCFFTQVQILQLLYKFIHILCKFLLTLCDFYTKII